MAIGLLAAGSLYSANVVEEEGGVGPFGWTDWAGLIDRMAGSSECPTSAAVGQIEGLHERRMAGSS